MIFEGMKYISQLQYSLILWGTTATNLT